MTGYRSSFYRYDCTKRGCQILALPDWDDILSAFPDRVRPTDIDAMVEINGFFLFIEQKGAGVSLPDRQRRALIALAAQPHTTVLIIRPHDEHGALEILMFPNPTGYQVVPRESFLSWLSAWARDAERQRA